MSTVTAGSYELDYWLRQIGRGDRDALEQLYNATSSAVYAYALSILKNSSDAQDAMHDTYLSILQKAADYRSQGKPLAWILTITRNHCLMLLRRQKRYVGLDASPVTSCSAPEDALILKLCMELLNDEDRQIVVLHAVAGITHRQIGQLMGIKTPTVLSRYHRAIRKLRQNL